VSTMWVPMQVYIAMSFVCRFVVRVYELNHSGLLEDKSDQSVVLNMVVNHFAAL